MARERKFTQEELYQATKQLLLEHGYEGYTFTLLANQLNISRAAIYKYYDNKDELLSEYMVYELDAFLRQLHEISKVETFTGQFDALFAVLFNDMSLYQLRDMGMQIVNVNKKVAANKRKISELHTRLYTSLQQFVDQGKQEQKIRDDIPSTMVLGMIFQTVNIPNTEGLQQQAWVKKLKEVICHGIFTTS